MFFYELIVSQLISNCELQNQNEEDSDKMVLGTGNFVLSRRCEINDGMKCIRLA